MKIISLKNGASFIRAGRQLTVFSVLSLIVACGGGGEVSPLSDSADSDHSDNPHSHALDGRFSASADGIWPPQPRAVSNVVEMTADSESAEIQKSKMVAARQIAMEDTQVKQALGTNYAQFSTRLPDSKAASTSTSIEFFKYDSNEVVTVDVTNAATIDISRRTADRYQPPESKVEARQAISLAATALQEQGYSDLSALKGTALLAYPTTAEVAASGKQFYAERMLYVTFGPGKGKAPHYRALVNLSRNTVLNSGPIQ
ncbi:hypothetical protein AB833_16255 [Chromatiales bacterium (ex Bugula neritina AB1)]|nr:hypothetical protein AB833_16255 [Chromatiales bacterium (ex Bugula neritina AB1)]